MSRQKHIFHWGFGISTILLIAAVASGAEDFARGSQIRYAELPHAATWSAVIYLLLNLPVVVIGALLMAAIGRIFGLSVPVALVLFPPICVYLSYYWWNWLSHRLTRGAHP